MVGCGRAVARSVMVGWRGVVTTCERIAAPPSTGTMSPTDLAKRAAAYACGKECLSSGQRIGIGSGTTIRYLVDFIREELEAGRLKNIVCVPTSFLTRKLLQDSNIPVVSPETHYELDITIDGADELDKDFNCIKGGGGCLTQEKIVQHMAKQFIVIADAAKLSSGLGELFRFVPLEVVPFAFRPVQKEIELKFGGRCELRMASNKCGAVITDNNNYILDWYFPSPTQTWAELNQLLKTIPGVVETGLFLSCVNRAYLGSPDGEVIALKP